MFLGLLVIVVLSSGWWHLSQHPSLLDELMQKAAGDADHKAIDTPLSGIPDFGSMLDVRQKKPLFLPL